MKELKDIKVEIAEMSKVALKMLELTHQAFMEHDLDLIAAALEEENKLNAQEKVIDNDLIEWGRGCDNRQERLKAGIYADVVGDFELIGDYCKDILERVQIKIEEKLLFSEEAVTEYNNLYETTRKVLRDISEALDKDNLNLLKNVIKKEKHLDDLVDECREKHTQRMIDGACTPMACNMFLNILDFTAAIYYHVKKVIRSLIKTK